MAMPSRPRSPPVRDAVADVEHHLGRSRRRGRRRAPGRRAWSRAPARARPGRRARTLRGASMPGPRVMVGSAPVGARPPRGDGSATAGPASAGSDVRSAAPEYAGPGHGELGGERQRVAVDPRRDEHERRAAPTRSTLLRRVRGSTCIETIFVARRGADGSRNVVRSDRRVAAKAPARGDPSRSGPTTSTRSARCRRPPFGGPTSPTPSRWKHHWSTRCAPIRRRGSARSRWWPSTTRARSSVMSCAHAPGWGRRATQCSVSARSVFAR